MKYGDEDIIAARIELQAKQANSIDNTVSINGISYKFSEREFPLGFSMIVPEAFDTLDKNLARIKYPYEDRPQIIITNPDASVGFAFDCAGLAAQDLNERMAKYRAIIKRLHPSFVFYTQMIYELSDEIRVACYDYRSQALDTDIYNISFFADLHDRELLGWFNCPADAQTKWEPLVRQMVHTIKPLPQEEQKG